MRVRIPPPQTNMPFDPFAGLLDSLSKGAKASYGFLRSLALEKPELSKAGILNTLKEGGFGIRREIGLDLIDLVRNKADVATFIKTFGENAIIPNSLHTLSPTHFLGGNKVQYLVGTNSSNPLIPEAIYVNAPAGLSADQIYGAAASYFNGNSDPYLTSDTLPEVIFTIDDARFAPGEQLTGEFIDNTEYSGA